MSTQEEMSANADIPVSVGERRHDPLCPDGRADHNKPPVSQCGWCDFATRVREDERSAVLSLISVTFTESKERHEAVDDLIAGLLDDGDEY